MEKRSMFRYKKTKIMFRNKYFVNHSNKIQFLFIHLFANCCLPTPILNMVGSKMSTLTRWPSWQLAASWTGLSSPETVRHCKPHAIPVSTTVRYSNTAHLPNNTRCWQDCGRHVTSWASVMWVASSTITETYHRFIMLNYDWMAELMCCFLNTKSSNQIILHLWMLLPIVPIIYSLFHYNAVFMYYFT